MPEGPDCHTGPKQGPELTGRAAADLPLIFALQRSNLKVE